MKKISMLILCLSAAVLSGCNDTESPEGVLSVAYSALVKGDVARFRATLNGQAKQLFADDNSVVSLMDDLKGRELMLGNPVLESSERVSSADKREWEYRYYRLDVFNKAVRSAPYVSSLVSCWAYKGSCPGARPELAESARVCWLTTKCQIQNFLKYQQ